MHGQRIGYTRVSTLDQNPDRQLEGALVKMVFTYKASGKDSQRPSSTLCSATSTVATRWLSTASIASPVTRATMRRMVQQLTGRGMRIEFIKEGLTFISDDSPRANLLLSVMGPSPSSSAN